MAPAVQDKARAAATLACETYNSPTTSAPSTSEALDLAAADARSAAQADTTWRPLATDLTQYAGFPETGNTPAQEAQGSLDRQGIVRTCGGLTSSALPGVIADCTGPPPASQQPQIVPGSIVVACADGGISFGGLTWTAWTASDATGSGQLFENDCTPDCARGTFHHYRASLTVTTVVTSVDGPVFSVVDVSYPDGGPNGKASGTFALPTPRP